MSVAPSSFSETFAPITRAAGSAEAAGGSGELWNRLSWKGLDVKQGQYRSGPGAEDVTSELNRH
jgi:hypothetical protein